MKINLSSTTYLECKIMILLYVDFILEWMIPEKTYTNSINKKIK